MTSKADKAIQLGRHMIDTRNTFARIGKEFNVSPSTAHRYIRIILPEVNPDLAEQCRVIAKYHACIAHIRGGEGNKISLKKRAMEASHETET